MEWSVFVQNVLSAVTHLHDAAALRDQPLAVTLFPTIRRDERGPELARLLTVSIELLQTEDSPHPAATASRHYQYLSLRYCQGLRAAQVAEMLGLSERQARRVHQEAVEALASLIWSRRQTPSTASEPAATRPASALDVEVTRLGTLPSRAGTHLPETLKGAVATVAPLARQHAVRIEIEAPANLPWIAIDRAILRQILVNLVVAAVELGARSLTIWASQAGAGVDVSLRIRFRTLGDGHPTERIRMGESLAVVQRLLELQEGRLEARSADAATFVATLHLPILRPATILLVDDNPDTLRLFRRYLTGGAYRVIEAEDGHRAWDLALQARPDALILDVMMPTQDGWETLQALRYDAKTKDIPIIVCSVLRQRELALSLGASAFLEKPVSREDLLSILQPLLASRPAPRHPPESAG